MTVNMDVGDYEGDDKVQELAIEFVNNSSKNLTLDERIYVWNKTIRQY